MDERRSAGEDGNGEANWTHPRLILVATDLTDQDRIMPVAIRMAAETSARLILLHVLPSRAGLTVDVSGMPYYNVSAAMGDAAESLEIWCELAQRQNLCCDALVRTGYPGEEIESAIRQFQPDRLVLGTRCRGRLGKLLLGSVAEQVLRAVNLPVITVGPEAHLPAAGDRVEPVVLHATSLRDTSRTSAALACALAGSMAAKLVLLHVLPSLEEMDRERLPRTMDEVALDELRRLPRTGCGLDVVPSVAHGTPAIEILAEAAARRATLIVLGATDRRPFDKLTGERIVCQVLAHARCPVMTLRQHNVEAVHARRSELAVQV